jgi:hypothetical protein
LKAYWKSFQMQTISNPSLTYKSEKMILNT